MKLQQFLIALLAIVLAACAPARLTPPVSVTDAQNTAISVIGTGVALTQTALPVATPLPPTFTPTTTMVYPTPSPLPTNPPTIMITPDAIQVERWQEYQTELAKRILFDASAWSPDYYEHSLCEWVILERSDQEVYVYAACSGPGTEGRRPVVIYLEANGAIRNVKVAGYKGPYFDLDLFPVNVQEKISSYRIPRE